jgi:succinate-semialdehyde dehydrogenase/glutarate-semialdehyde dehydrogenase
MKRAARRGRSAVSRQEEARMATALKDFRIQLTDPSLFREQCYVDGAWVDADNRATSEVTDPASGEVIGTVPRMGAAETRQAIEAADRAFKGWSRTPAKERSKILRKWFDLMMANQEDLAILMTREQGKPLAESRGEIAYGAAFVEWFAEEGKRVYGDIIPTVAESRRLMVFKQPVGVCAAITPWNFPNAMITRKCGPALAAGCTVVVKPASFTPYSALALAELGERAGIPKGVFNVVTGSAKEVGGELTSNDTVRKLSFTGSTEVGKILLKQCADTVKKVSMELGGHAPLIIFDDADLEAAVKGAIACKFRNSGQTCVCTNRIYVQEKIYDAFAERFAAAVGRLKVGSGLEPGVEQGPLIEPAAIAKVERHVSDAKSHGAKVLTGGSSSSRTRTRSSALPTRPSTGSPLTSTPATSAGSSRSPRRWRPASSRSTRASSRPRWRRLAATNTRASAARARSTASMSTSRSNTSTSAASPDLPRLA